MAYIPIINNTRLGADAVTTDKVLNGTLTDSDVDAANKDGSVGVPSLRTIGTGALQAMAGSTRLDTIAAPTGPVNANSQKITSVADGTNPGDAVNYGQLTAMAVGLVDYKDSVRAVSTTDITLSGTQTVDGVALVAGNRILVAGQTASAANGIYVVAAGAWARAADANSSAEVTAGMYLAVAEGTLYADSVWLLATNDAIVLDTTALTFIEMPNLTDLVGGAGLTKTGNSVDVGAGTGITVNANDVAIDTSVVPRKGVANTYSAKQTFTTFSSSIQVVAGNHTIDLAVDSVIVLNTTGAIRTATLPAAHTAGDEVTIKRSGVNNAVVATADSDTIDGSASDYTMEVDLMALTFKSDGTGWWVL